MEPTVQPPYIQFDAQTRIYQMGYEAAVSLHGFCSAAGHIARIREKGSWWFVMVIKQCW